MRKHRRNITIVNNEIDYDKLAEAIVKAQIGINKPKKSTSKFRGAAMSFLNGVVYITICIFSVWSIYRIWTEIYVKQNASFNNCIIATILMSFIGIYAFLCQQESLQEKDSDAKQHFDANVSFVALIVAIIAFLKGAI